MSIEIVKGIIGWSKWRTGCEFYEDTEQTEGKYARWLPRAVYDPENKQPHGRLLTDALGDPEGAEVIVVVMPRSVASLERSDVEKAIRAAVEDAS